MRPTVVGGRFREVYSCRFGRRGGGTVARGVGVGNVRVVPVPKAATAAVVTAVVGEKAVAAVVGVVASIVRVRAAVVMAVGGGGGRRMQRWGWVAPTSRGSVPWEALDRICGAQFKRETSLQRSSRRTL